MGFLYQIEERQKKKQAAMKLVGPSKEVGKMETETAAPAATPAAPEKPPEPTTKTMGLPVPPDIHARLSALRDKRDPNRKALKDIALQAIRAGLPHLEREYGWKP